jgi:hypothetical protein
MISGIFYARFLLQKGELELSRMQNMSLISHGNLKPSQQRLKDCSNPVSGGHFIISCRYGMIATSKVPTIVADLIRGYYHTSKAAGVHCA